MIMQIILADLIIFIFAIHMLYSDDTLKTKFGGFSNFAEYTFIVSFFGFLVSLPIVFWVDRKAGLKGLLTWIAVMVVFILVPMISMEEIDAALAKQAALAEVSGDNATTSSDN